MRATPIGRALRFAVPAVAAGFVAAAGGSVTGPGGAAGDPCADGALTIGQARLPCVDTVPPPPTSTETDPVEEPPPATETPEPAAPPPAATTAPAETSIPPKRRTRTGSKRAATATSPAPPKTTKPVSRRSGFANGAFAPRPYTWTPELSGGPYVFPVLGPTSFSDTWGAARANVGWHHGVDILAPRGSPIVAVADGVLFSVGWNTIGGQRLWLRDREGNYFYYAHLSAFARIAVDGARVRAGTVIGYVGNTGDAAGGPDHLHFEIHPSSLLSFGYDGAVDPFPYVSSWPRLDVSMRAGAAAAAAPAPGAFLLGFRDISSASGLAPASLNDAVEEAAVAAARIEPEGTEITASETTLTPADEEAARIARALDSGALRPAGYGATVWDRLAFCESGGDWGSNTGNGFIGGLQFLPQTWDAHGGTAFAPSPYLATREQQIAVAERVLASQGWHAWPACSAMLGLQALATK